MHHGTNIAYYRIFYDNYNTIPGFHRSNYEFLTKFCRFFENDYMVNALILIWSAWLDILLLSKRSFLLTLSYLYYNSVQYYIIYILFSPLYLLSSVSGILLSLL